MAARLLGWVRGGVIGAYAVAIVAGLFLPVYTDEVGWRFQERAGLDGVDKMYTEACGANTLARPAWFMWPARWYSALFNTLFADPFWVRVSGVAYALCFGALVLALAGRVARDRQDRDVLAILGLGLALLGVMPLLMVWSRPEQPILLAATAAVLLALAGAGETAGDGAARRACGRSLAIVALATIAVSYHVRGLFMLPVFLVALALAGRGRAALAPRLVALPAMLAMAAAGARHWRDRLSCPDDPVLARFYDAHNLGGALARIGGPDDLPALVARMVANANPFAYVLLAAPRREPMSAWLEPGLVGPAAELLWARALVLLWTIALLAGLFAMARAGARAWRERRADPRLLLALALAASAFGWMAMVSIRNVYEAKLVLPLLALALVLALSAAIGEARVARVARGLALLLGPCAFASALAMTAIVAPSLARANRHGGYIDRQPTSTPVLGYRAVERDILAAARLCAIPPPERARAVLVDDASYFAYMRSTLPQHYLGLTGLWKGRITDPLAYLRARRSDGAVLGCRHLPAGLRARARRVGEICCLPAP